MIEAGSIVRYTGPDLVAYQTGKTYKVEGYVKPLDLYAVMSELGEAYCLPEEYLQEVLP